MTRRTGDACLIGVDVGTTNVKAGAFTPEGRALAIASAELRIDRPKPGWALYNPAELWGQTVRVLVEVSRALAGRLEPGGGCLQHGRNSDCDRCSRSAGVSGH